MTARINLAPEVYQQHQADKRHKRLATSLAILVSGVSIGIVALLLFIIGGQKVYLANVQGTINNDETRLQGYPDLQAAATIQQDLTTLTTLQGQRVYLSRFFNILQQTDPQGVELSKLTTDSTNQLEIDATASDYSLATKLAKALEASNVTIGQNAASSNQPYFTNVDLSTVSDNGSGSVEFKLTTQLASEVTSGKQ